MASRVTINTNSLNVPWSLGTTYRIALDAGFVAEPDNNRSGNPAVNNLVTFTTNASRPELNSTNPSNGDNDVTNNTSITLTFSRNVEAGPGTIRLYRADNTDELIYTYNMGDPAWVTISNTTVTLKTTGLLREEELYLLLIDNNAIRDLDNFTYLGSRTAKTITAAGNAQWNNTESKFGGTASIQFDGVGDYVTVATASDFAWNTNTFTWEAWIKKTSVTGTQAIFDQRTASLLNNGYLYTAGTQLIYQAAGSARITSASSVIQNNTWYNIMLTRDGTGTTKLYVNGTQVGSSYTDSNSYAQAPVIIGADYLGSNGFVGYMEDIRFRKLISGATALPTKYRVNDADTVLHIIQSGEAVNGSQTIEDNVSTVQFDTANQSQGFRGLTASMTTTATLTPTQWQTIAIASDGTTDTTSDTGPYITLYNLNKNTNTITKVSDANVYKPSGSGTFNGNWLLAGSVSWSNDGLLLAVLHGNLQFPDTLRQISILERTSDTLTLKYSGPYITASNILSERAKIRWNPQSSSLAVIYNNAGSGQTNTIKIYNWNGSNLIDITPSAMNSLEDCTGISWNYDGSSIVISHSNSPFMSVYNRSGDTFTKINDPSIMPPSAGVSVAFNPDGTKIALGLNSNPGFVIYNRSGDVLTGQSSWPATSSVRAYDIAWNHNGSSICVDDGDWCRVYDISGNTVTYVNLIQDGIPIWSGDGEYINIMNRDTGPSLYAYKRNGSTFTEVTIVNGQTNARGNNDIAWFNN